MRSRTQTSVVVNVRSMWRRRGGTHQARKRSPSWITSISAFVFGNTEAAAACSAVSTVDAQIRRLTAKVPNAETFVTTNNAGKVERLKMPRA